MGNSTCRPFSSVVVEIDSFEVAPRIDFWMFKVSSTIVSKFLSIIWDSLGTVSESFTTVWLCVDMQTQVECSNGQVAFGRKRRDVAPETDSNWRKDRVFEVSMTTMVKLDEQTNIKKGSFQILSIWITVSSDVIHCQMNAIDWCIRYRCVGFVR